MKSTTRHTAVVFLALFAVCGLLIASAGSASAATNGGTTASASKKHHRHHHGKRGPRGPRGPAGPQGAEGPQGPAGKGGLTKIVDVQGTIQLLCSPGGPCATRGKSVATCPAGYEVIGGGWDTIPGVIPGVEPSTFPDSTVITNRATSRTTWTVTLRSNASAPPGQQSAFAAFAVCGTPQ